MRSLRATLIAGASLLCAGAAFAAEPTVELPQATQMPSTEQNAPAPAPNGPVTNKPGITEITSVAGPKETLTDALVSAYTSNPDLLSAQAQLRALDESIPQATAGWKPTVTLSGSWGDQETRIGAANTAAIKSVAHPLQGTATVSQPLFRGGRTYYGMREAERNVDAGRAKLMTTEQQTLLNAITAYFTVIQDRATVDLNQNNVQVLQKQLDAAQDRFRVGEITRTDVAQAEARLSLGQTQLIQSQAQLVAAEDSFKTSVGHQPGALDPAPPLPQLPETEAVAHAAANKTSPTLVAARETAKAASDAVAVAYAQLAPQVTLQGQADHSQGEGSFGPFTGFGDLRTDTLGLTGQLTVPIYQAGTEYATIRQAKHTASADHLQVQETQREVDENVATAWENLRAAGAAIESNQDQVRADQIAYDGVVQEAEVGSRTTLDVLNAEQELLNSQVSLVQSQRDQYVAAFTLLSTMGALTAKDLGLPVKIYDPTANTRSLKWKQFWPGAGEK